MHGGYDIRLPPLKPWFDSSLKSNLFSLIAMKLACRNDGEGGYETPNSCRMREVEIVGTVELVCIGRLLRMGCDSFLMPVCGPVGGGNLCGSRMDYHRNIPLPNKL